ncbi:MULTISPECIES: sensor histidine kinase [unclassified Cupriavidus]|uniref:sensor histidine kinase n=1 Tax=Cupriavidus sp. H19C3 TaxID=3241603 RepID=UPI003BF8E2E6
MKRSPSWAGYWAVGAALVCLASLPIAWTMYAEGRHHLRLLASRDALAFFAAALRAYEAVSAEREPTNALFASLAPAEFERRLVEMRRARARTDTELGNLVHALRRANCVRCPSMVNALNVVSTRLAETRHVMDALRSDDESRTARGTILRAVNRMMSATEPFTAILNQCTLQIAELNAATTEAVLLARNIADMREYAGRLGALLLEPLATARRLTQDDRERLAITEGRILQLRDLIAIRVASVPNRDALVAEIDSMTSDYFNDAYMRATQLIVSGEQSAHGIAQPPGFIDGYRRGMHAIVRFRDSVLQPAAADLVAAIEAHERKVVAVGVVNALVLAALVCALFVFRGQYVSPLEKLTRAMLSLGGGHGFGRDAGREALMTSLSHDMRSPQASILALLDMARTTETYRAAPDLFARIESNARRTLDMVDDFVRLSELQVLSYRPAEVDLYGLMLDACDDLTVAAQARHIRLVPSEPDGAPYLVHAEPDSLYRAIANVLDNAIKYGPAHDAIHCTLQRNGRHLELSIRDRGPGIRPQDMPYLFERFRRFPTADAEPVPGNGLGLAFAKAAIGKARGQIRCRSVLGEGSEFIITLPARGAKGRARARIA